jgi:hypothetical protein
MQSSRCFGLRFANPMLDLAVLDYGAQSWTLPTGTAGAAPSPRFSAMLFFDRPNSRIVGLGGFFSPLDHSLAPIAPFALDLTQPATTGAVGTTGTTGSTATTGSTGSTGTTAVAAAVNHSTPESGALGAGGVTAIMLGAVFVLFVAITAVAVLAKKSQSTAPPSLTD